MKKLIPFLALLVLVGCMTAGRTAYTTLAAIEATTTQAYRSYLDFVVAGQIATNNVPYISKDYNIFKMVWGQAVAVAQWNTNAAAPSDVINASAKVILGVSTAKQEALQ